MYVQMRARDEQDNGTSGLFVPEIMASIPSCSKPPAAEYQVAIVVGAQAGCLLRTSFSLDPKEKKWPGRVANGATLGEARRGAAGGRKKVEYQGSFFQTPMRPTTAQLGQGGMDGHMAE